MLLASILLAHTQADKFIGVYKKNTNKCSSGLHVTVATLLGNGVCELQEDRALMCRDGCGEMQRICCNCWFYVPRADWLGWKDVQGVRRRAGEMRHMRQLLHITPELFKALYVEIF